MTNKYWVNLNKIARNLEVITKQLGSSPEAEEALILVEDIRDDFSKATIEKTYEGQIVIFTGKYVDLES